jgi:hypothetical protein
VPLFLGRLTGGGLSCTMPELLQGKFGEIKYGETLPMETETEA